MHTDELIINQNLIINLKQSKKRCVKLYRVSRDSYSDVKMVKTHSDWMTFIFTKQQGFIFYNLLS